MVVELGAGDGERGLERGGREVGERRGDAGQPGQGFAAAQVGGGDPQEPRTVGMAERVDALAPGETGHGDVRPRVGADGGQQLRPDGRHGPAERGVGVGQHREQLGVPDQLVAERGRRAEDGQQPLPDDLRRYRRGRTLDLRSKVSPVLARRRPLTLRCRSSLGAPGREGGGAAVAGAGREHVAQERERLAVPGGVATLRRLRQPHEREQRQVRVRDRAQRVEQR
ncbi:hypothetical protein GCM10025864_34080 [Luteimicrobium album]|uniref:Uncharacterized protein n=1 Tax=Luteimicrobium album TaxID=1054550 RepID=A0ABQ6I6S1_9MICO|nr:hypothetical protein GCM10025864_34080 [Luteimicrobium album]